MNWFYSTAAILIGFVSVLQASKIKHPADILRVIDSGGCTPLPLCLRGPICDCEASFLFNCCQDSLTHIIQSHMLDDSENGKSKYIAHLRDAMAEDEDATLRYMTGFAVGCALLLRQYEKRCHEVFQAVLRESGHSHSCANCTTCQFMVELTTVHAIGQQLGVIMKYAVMPGVGERVECALRFLGRSNDNAVSSVENRIDTAIETKAKLSCSYLLGNGNISNTSSNMLKKQCAASVTDLLLYYPGEMLYKRRRRLNAICRQRFESVFDPRKADNTTLIELYFCSRFGSDPSSAIAKLCLGACSDLQDFEPIDNVPSLSALSENPSGSVSFLGLPPEIQRIIFRYAGPVACYFNLPRATKELWAKRTVLRTMVCDYQEPLLVRMARYVYLSQSLPWKVFSKHVKDVLYACAQVADASKLEDLEEHIKAFNNILAAYCQDKPLSDSGDASGSLIKAYISAVEIIAETTIYKSHIAEAAKNIPFLRPPWMSEEEYIESVKRIVTEHHVIPIVSEPFDNSVTFWTCFCKYKDDTILRKLFFENPSRFLNRLVANSLLAGHEFPEDFLTTFTEESSLLSVAVKKIPLARGAIADDQNLFLKIIFHATREYKVKGAVMLIELIKQHVGTNQITSALARMLFECLSMTYTDLDNLVECDRNVLQRAVTILLAHNIYEAYIFEQAIARPTRWEPSLLKNGFM